MNEYSVAMIPTAIQHLPNRSLVAGSKLSRKVARAVRVSVRQYLRALRRWRRCLSRGNGGRGTGEVIYMHSVYIINGVCISIHLCIYNAYKYTLTTL